MVNAEMETKDSSDKAHQWLACAARMAAAGKSAALPLYGTVAGRRDLGRGAGGDQTLEIDRACEAAIRRVLLEEAPGLYRLVSEEAGLMGPGDAPWCVVVDPVDGSLNAKHGLQTFGASIAVADGGALRDVTVGYVEDYTRPHAFAAVRGAGLVAAGEPGSAGHLSEGSAAEEAVSLRDTQRFGSELVELMLLEAGRPDRNRFQYHDLSVISAGRQSGDMRVRQIGSIALSLCYLATGVADVLVATVRARSVDLAAGMLILAETGGGAAALTDADIWAQPLDLEKRSPFVAWRAGLDGEQIAARAREFFSTALLSS